MTGKTRTFLLSAVLTLSLGACVTDQAAEESGKFNAVLEQATHDAFMKGQVKESTELLGQLYKRNSDDPKIALRYAGALRANDQLYRAALVLAPFVKKDTVLEDNMLKSAIQTEYASLQAAMGNYAIAEEHARRAIVTAPENGKAYHVLGIALDTQGFHKQAETAFRKALETWSGDPGPVMNNLGLNLAAQGFLDEASETLRKAYAASPGRVEIERNLRIVTALQKKPFEDIELDIPPPPIPGIKPVREKDKAGDPEGRQAGNSPQVMEAAALREKDTAEPAALDEKDIKEIAATPPKTATKSDATAQTADKTAQTEPAAGENAPSKNASTDKEMAKAIARNLND